MLQNPEETYDESITVYADSDEQARAKCERMAQARSQRAIVQCIGCVRMTKAGRYTCTIRIEPQAGESL